MRILLIAGALGLALAVYNWTSPGAGTALVATAAAATGTAPAVQAKACLRCHEDEYVLSGVEVHRLVEQIKAIRDGAAEHPKRIDLSDSQIEAIAAILGKQ